MDLRMFIIFVGLAIMPLSVLLFAPIFIQKWIAPFNKPLIFSLGFSAVAFEFYSFYRVYGPALEAGRWTDAAGAMATLPFYATYIMLVACVLGAALGVLVQTRKLKLVPIALVLVTAGLLATTMTTVTTDSNLAAIELHQGHPLTLEAIQHMEVKDLSKDKSQVAALLSNQACPEDVLREYAKKDVPFYRIAVAKNPNTPEDLIMELSRDPLEIVRYYTTISKKISMPRLKEMIESDPSKDVRKQAIVTMKFERDQQTTTK